jgi:hypothetical protein
MLWTDYVNKEVKAMTYMSKGKSIKGLTGAIAAYNAFKKGQDAFKLGLDRQKTPYPCGTVTCKERGQKIKEALTVLATFSPDSLGSFDMSGAFSSASDWMNTSKSQNIDLKYASFLGLPPDLVEDVTNGDADASNVPVSNPPVSTSPVSNPPVSTSPVSNPPVSTSPVSNPPVSDANAKPASKWFWGGKRTRRR